MFITNLTSSTFILYEGYVLRPENQVTIPDSVYSGNSTLKNQVDTLLANGMIYAYDKPIDPSLIEETPELPDNYEAAGQDFVITKESGIASLSVDSDLNGCDYGSIEMAATSGSSSSLRAYSDDAGEGMLEINKNSNEDGNLLLLKIDGLAVMQIGATGAIAFDGKNPIVPPTLNPGTGTTTDIINAMINLGLARNV